MLECVVNVSEGLDPETIGALADAAGTDLLDVHTDPHHNRSVLTLIGETAPRAVARAAVDLIDLRTHGGAHPRIGAVDVVPFVPLGDSTMQEAVAARDRFGRWAAEELDLPSFRYGPERSLPEVRRGAFTALAPDFGPTTPHPTAGAVAVGARPLLVAYNCWFGGSLAEARSVAKAIRRPGLRTLGLQVGDRVQVSMNLTDPLRLGPAEAHDLAAAHGPVVGAELVGLVPDAVLDGIPEDRWRALDIGVDRTIGFRLARRDAAVSAEGPPESERTWGGGVG